MDLAKLFDEARKGNRDAAWQLGDLYREAMHGVKYSPKQAFRWYAESALAGSATGQNNVGASYEHGLGCQQNYAKAAKWYRLAAETDAGRLRYLIHLFAKEIVLRNFGRPGDADLLERLVQVLTHLTPANRR